MLASAMQQGISLMKKVIGKKQTRKMKRKDVWRIFKRKQDFCQH